MQTPVNAANELIIKANHKPTLLSSPVFGVGLSGIDGLDGSSGLSGTSGFSGVSGFTGESGAAGVSLSLLFVNAAVAVPLFGMIPSAPEELTVYPSLSPSVTE